MRGPPTRGCRKRCTYILRSLNSFLRCSATCDLFRNCLRAFPDCGSQFLGHQCKWSNPEKCVASSRNGGKRAAAPFSRFYSQLSSPRSLSPAQPPRNRGSNETEWDPLGPKRPIFVLHSTNQPCKTKPL